MSNYTTQLRYLCEKKAGLEVSESSYLKVDEIIEKAEPLIFGTYPIFDEDYRAPLNKKILRHFYQQEIGFETEGQFIFRLNVKMNEIMPYYNKLYQLDLEDIDLFQNVDYVEHYTGEDKGQNDTEYGRKDTEERNFTDQNSGQTQNKFIANNSATGSNEHTDNTQSVATDNTGSSYSHDDRFSDTPETDLSGVTDKTYLTQYRLVKDTTTNNGDITTRNTGTMRDEGSNQENKDETNTLTDTRGITHTGSGSHQLSGKDVLSILMGKKYDKTIKGKNGIDPVDQILKIRQSFLNIDMMIIHDLEQLFMQIW